jgi:tetratricopeptide (TPR) repeat protein
VVLPRHGRRFLIGANRLLFGAALLWALAGCSTVRPSEGAGAAADQPPVPISGAYSDELLLQLTALRGGLTGAQHPAPELQRLCDEGDLTACGLAMRYSPSAAQRVALRGRLLEVPHKLSRRTWGFLVVSAEPPGLRRALAKQALVFHPEADELLSAAQIVPGPTEAFRRFSSRPGLLTLLALSARLVQDGAWQVMEQVLELAALSGDREILESPEFWYLRGRVRSQTGDALGAQGAFALASMVRRPPARPTEAERRSLVALAKSLLDGPENLSMVAMLLDRSGVTKGPQTDERLFALKAMVALSHRVRTLSALLLEGKGPAGALGVLPALLGGRFEDKPKVLRQLFARAVTMVPESVLAWRRLGSAEAKVGHYREAIGAFRNALRLEPDNPEILNNLAYTLCTREERSMDEAERLARRSIFLARSPAALDSLAEIRFRKGDSAGALRMIQLALRLMPDSPFYKAQEARIRAGDPKVPVPNSEEEGDML